MTDWDVRTALDLPVEDWKHYDPAGAIRQHKITNRPELARRRRRALRTARQAANLLRETFGAQRVALFGSLAERAGFTLWSDIDLAVWGILPQQFYAAVAAVTGLSAEFKIDLVDPNSCRRSLRNAIEYEGIDL